ncbi:MAG: DUF4159 domain-containing protein [Rhodospirillaceae bacterium]
MLNLGTITFTLPWVLIAFTALPLVWLLLRITPPAARKLSFPAIQLLFGLASNETSSALTPWWMALLRLTCLVLIIFALADPVLNERQGMRNSPLVTIIDDGWAAASTWSQRQAALVSLLEGAVRDKRPTMLVTTAPSKAGPQDPYSFAPASDTLAKARSLEPKPWSTDKPAVLQRLENSNLLPPTEIVWITDGISSDLDTVTASWLQRLGRLTVLTDPNRPGPFFLGSAERSVERNTNVIDVSVHRPISTDARPFTIKITALDETNRTIASTATKFDAGMAVTTAQFAVPIELGNRMTQLVVENENSAAGVFLLDGSWTRRPVGIVSANPDGIVTPLLEDGFYVTQALSPYAEIHAGTIASLLAQNHSMIVLASGTRVTDPEIALLEPWLSNGGVLVRFSGSTMDGNVDPLLPVRLRGGGRTFGGTMSWTEPVKLAAFNEDGPFAGLVVPNEVLISTQLLAEPSPGLSQRTWASLEDGTPLVTAERRGQGWIVLFHVTATPDWSTLPLSGAMVGMLRRILDLSRGVAQPLSKLPQSLFARQILNGSGQLITPPPTVLALDRNEINNPSLSPIHPPGYYGDSNSRIAINLGPSIGPVSAQGQWPSDVTVSGLDSIVIERTLRPWLLFAALSLFIFDFILSLALRGITPSLRMGHMVLPFCLLLLFFSANSNTALGVNAKLKPATISAVLATRIAYVRTGQEDIDLLSAQGLEALTKILTTRTSAEMASPSAINPEIDDLFPYPFVYWRVAPDQLPPSEKAARHINDYLGRGGMLVLDAPNQVGANAADDGQKVSTVLNNILVRLNIPPLVQVPENHVLQRSFYLLQDLPGRYAGAPVYIERGSVANDGVSSIIVGSHDWAAGWAIDARGIPVHPMVPGGERQRELSYRFGVNLVMYALTGNYKADQVHLPAIMQRLTQ